MTLRRGRIVERNPATGDLARHFRVNMDVTSNPRRALRRMYVWHLGGSVALESDGVNADMDAFEDDDEMLPDNPVLLDELEALLDWVWDSYGPCGCILKHDEREEIPDRFNAWRESLGHNADGSPMRIVSFRAFGRWFLDLHQHFVYIRRHEAATDIFVLEQHEEEDGDIVEKHVEFKENHEEAPTSLMLERVVQCLLNDSSKSIDEVHVYRGVQETKEADVRQHDEEKEEQYVKVTVKTIEDRLRKRSRVRATPLHSSNWTTVSVSSVEGTPTVDGSRTPNLTYSDKELKEPVTNRVDWGEMCETCADFDDDHIEDSITAEPEDETEAWQRHAMNLPVDDDDRHAEECITGDDVDNVNDGSSDDSDDDFKAPVYEDKYAEDFIADPSDDDDDAVPCLLPTRKKSMDPRVGIAPVATLPVTSSAVDAAPTRSRNHHQQQQQVMPLQPPHVSNESVSASTAVVIDAPAPPPTIRMPRRPTAPQPVVPATMHIIPVVVPPPPPAPAPAPPASPSLSAQTEPLPATAVRELPPQVRIPLRRVIVPPPSAPISTVVVAVLPPPIVRMPMEKQTLVGPVDAAAIGSQQIGTIYLGTVPVVTVPVSTTATTDSPLTVRMPNVDEEERGALVDVSELYNLWGDNEYDAPLENRQRRPSYGEDYLLRTSSGVFEYDDEDDEKNKNHKK